MQSSQLHSQCLEAAGWKKFLRWSLIFHWCPMITTHIASHTYTCAFRSFWPLVTTWTAAGGEQFMGSNWSLSARWARNSWRVQKQPGLSCVSGVYPHRICTPAFLGIPATGYVQHVYPGIPLTEYVPSISRYTRHRICPTFVGMIPDITCDVVWLTHSGSEPSYHSLRVGKTPLLDLK